MLQKKRLEYLMKQSEIYAHFMSNKMGMAEETKKARDEVLSDEAKNNYARADVDEKKARRKLAKMINHDKKRLRQFDAGDQNVTMHHDSEDEVNPEDLDFDVQDNQH